ncbi:hypothetical protein H257_13795 [Aphanomyces astaci]|uniref:Uncharacterized protein n=1 Tax=Aphanomyces astaci TaxID=112090 RepID=W4FUR9_APHAT|nr:hypothetical protein H257_13795 [Aphanomyces astaci]ETV70696.1 hypothetical protein H257_13795 [Aphanomyces astaci]|eukprot:XP_009839760.1 hypothetical protein H257_13795 [Aphanomyces astaci]
MNDMTTSSPRKRMALLCNVVVVATDGTDVVTGPRGAATGVQIAATVEAGTPWNVHASPLKSKNVVAHSGNWHSAAKVATDPDDVMRDVMPAAVVHLVLATSKPNGYAVAAHSVDLVRGGVGAGVVKYGDFTTGSQRVDQTAAGAP